MRTMNRIPPVPREEWTDAAREMFTLFEGPDAYEHGSKSNVFLTMARHPKLGTSFFKYSGRLLMTSKVDIGLRELVILRIAWLYRSAYEWAQHVEFALSNTKIDKDHIEAYKSGGVETDKAQGALTPAQIEAVKRGPDDPIFTDVESAALRAVDQLKETGHIDDATWQTLSSKLDEDVLIELVFYMGTYALLAWVFNAFGMEPEERQRHYAEDIYAGS